MRKTLTLIALLLCAVAASAQGSLTGGVKATVVNRIGRDPVAAAKIDLLKGSELVGSYKAGADGSFCIEGLENASYVLEVSAPDFVSKSVNVVVEGYLRDLVFITLTPQQSRREVDESNFADFDMDDSGYSDSPTILFGTNDPYNNVAGYGFSAIRFKNRGYESESQDVYFSGVRLNDALTGYTPYSLWTGLNEAVRSKESTNGLESSEFGIGGYNGVTNITGTPDAVRTGWRFSMLSNSALYRLRLMGTYASGELDNGWSYAVNVSARLGGNDWVEGVYYRSFAYYAGIGKRLNEHHSFNLVTFATPGQRGAQNASTQEVYDLMGDNMYNSNWGYQNGKVRNARVRKTFEPVTVLKYEFTPSRSFKSATTLLWRTGSNGYTALDWYDAPDPRPDYYRNLPSYFHMEDEDYNRSNPEKAAWAEYAWTHRGDAYRNYQHIDWDRLYNVNDNSPEGRSKYIQEERHTDQNDLNLAQTVKWLPTESLNVNAGLNLRWNRTENYKKVADLLGGNYYVNIDNFAERDFASDPAKIQNDLDYYLAHGEAQKLYVGDKYGYDYLAQIRKAQLWGSASYERGGLSLTGAASVGRESFWRDGLVRKGLFPDDSYGESEKSAFTTWAAKAGGAYVLGSSHRLSANLGFFNDAPTFQQSFVSPRTRNTLVSGLDTRKTFSADFNYQFSKDGWNLRFTAFYTDIKDQTDLMSFYDDSQKSFTNFAMTGIGQRHSGIEFGAKMPLPVEGLTLSAVVSAGRYIYVGKPHMIQTVDNSAEIIRDEDVTYWDRHPVYKIAGYDADGAAIYDQDASGEYVITGYRQHYVPSTPQLATQIALNYRTNSYWFFELNGQYFAGSYLDMNPLYRTTFAAAGGDGVVTPQEVSYMAEQEKFDPAFLMNCSIGKSWYIQRKYNIGFSLEVKNMLDNRSVKTGGYEQTRLLSSYGKDRYYRFDPKYFYMCGANYMLNIYFRF